MKDFKLGILADMGQLGEAVFDGTAMVNPDKYAQEFHFIPKSHATGPEWLFSKSSGTRGILIGTGQRLAIKGFASQDEFALSDDEFPKMFYGSKYRVRMEVDKTSGSTVITLILSNGVDPTVTIDASSFPGSLSYNPTAINESGGGDYLFAYMGMQEDTGSGWEDVHTFEPHLVSDGNGNFVHRTSDQAEDGADSRIYDTTNGFVYVAEKTSPTAFPAVYNILTVNGEENNPIIKLGSINNEVVLSNDIEINEVILSKNNLDYSVPFTRNANVLNFDVNIENNPNMPLVGTATLKVRFGVDVFEKEINFAKPDGFTVVTLGDYVATHNHAYSFEKPEIDAATGGIYFYAPTDDFFIRDSGVWVPKNAAEEWAHTVWYLSPTQGLIKTIARSSDAATLDDSTPVRPIAVAGPNVTDAVPNTKITLDGSGSTISSGSIASYQWRQISGTTVTLSDSTAVNPEFDIPDLPATETLRFELVVTSDQGIESRPDNVSIVVNVESDTDTTKPVIYVAGPNPLTIEHDEEFVMPEITFSEPIIDSPSVEGEVGIEAGTYELRITPVEDEEGNISNELIFTVIRKEAPLTANFTEGEITIGGYSNSINVNDSFEYPTASAVDGEGNDVSDYLERSGLVFTSLSGSYSVVWKLINNLNEVIATKQIRINVNPLPVEPPSLPGYEPVDVEAGDNKTVSPGAIVVLSGSSSNAGKSGVRYKWRQTKGSRVALKQKNQLSGATFEAPVTNLVNDLEFELTEWIGVKTFRSYITITVEDVQPYVEGIDTLLVNPNQLVELSVKPRYFDDEVTSVTWTETTAHGVTLKNDDTLTATMLVPNLADNAIISFDVQVNGQFNAAVDVTVKSGTIREFKSAINYSWID